MIGKILLALFIIIGVVFVSANVQSLGTDNIRVYYSMDDVDTTGVTLDDLSTADNNATVSVDRSGMGILGESKGFIEASADWLRSDNNFPSDMTGASQPWSLNSWVYMNSSGMTLGHNVRFLRIGAQTGVGSRAGTIALGGDNNYFLSGGGGADYNTATPLQLNSWMMLTATFDGTNLRMYVNGSIMGGTPVAKGYGLTASKIHGGEDVGGGENLDGQLDELSIWNYTLTAENITELYNSHAGFNPFTVVSDSGNIEILISNESHKQTYKTLYDESELFQMYINYTDSATGLELNDTDANCNITLINGLFHNESINRDFTICSTGCTFTSLTEEFYVEETDNAIKDLVGLTVCHENIPTADLSVTFQCGATTDIQTLSSNEFGLCSASPVPVLINSSSCLAFDRYNITLSNSAPNPQRHNITIFDLNREFSEHTLSGDELLFNSSLNLWQTEHLHHYIEHGTKIIHANCTHLTNSDFDKSGSTTLTIVDAKPTVDLIEFIFPDSTMGIFNTSVNLFEFQNGTYDILYDVIDDDLKNFTITIINSSSDVLFTVSNTLLIPVNVTSDLFVDFDGNSFNISLLAWDSQNFSYTSSLFNFTDNAPPSISGIGNESILNTSTFTFNMVATDEYLWSFNVACDNGVQSLNTGLGVKSFTYADSFIINATTICNWNVSDGHTANLMRNIDVISSKENNRLIFDGLALSSVEDVKDITYTKESDKVSFCFNTLSKENTITFNIPFGCVQAPNSKYMGHYVCYDKLLALDFENNDGYKILSMTNRDITLDVSKSGNNNHCFNSIVELNTIKGVKIINVTFPEELAGDFFEYELDPNSTSSVLLMFMFFIFLIGLWVLAYTFKSFAFAVFGMLIGVIIGLMLISFSPWLTICFTLINVAIMFEFVKTKT